MDNGRTDGKSWLRDRAMAAARNGVVITDPNLPGNSIIYASPGFERLTGYVAAEVIGKNCRFLQGEDRKQPALAELREAVRDGRECHVTLRNYKKDGTLFWNELFISPIRDGEGRLVNLVGVQQDVTGRVRAEQEATFRARLLDQVRAAVIATDLEGRVVHWNAHAEELYGWSPEEVLGRLVSELTFGPDEAGPAEEIMERLRAGEAWEGEFTVRRRDGSLFPAYVSDSLVRDEEGRAVGIVGVSVDITERKRTEEALRKSSRHTSDILESMTDAFFALDREWRITYMNKEAERIIRRGREELLGKNVWEEFPNSVGSAFHEGYHRAVETGQPVHSELFSAALDAWIEVHAYPEDDGLSIYFRDITERKLAEEALREVREAERQRIARDLHDEALQDLIFALQEIRATRRKTQSRELGAELEREIDALDRAVLGLRSAIHDLRPEGEREQTFAESLRSLVELNRQRAPDLDVELLIEEDFSLPLDEAGKVELLRLLGEALTNARKHSGARRVRAAIGASGGELRVEVTDDGKGLDQAQTPEGMGTKGMYERARALRGDLKIRSEPGKGTNVGFTLALERDREKSEEQVRILLVEDHASFRQAAASMFEGEPGFVVAGQAGSLAEARRMLDEVDVAVVDLGLPDGDGGELIEELRKKNPQAQALVLSANLQRYETARAIERGAAGVLHKSASFVEIIDAVRRLKAGETLLPLEEVIELLRIAGSHREREQAAREKIRRLTTREREVLQALAEGLDSRAVAERLHISVQTQRNHVNRILIKLDVHSQLQALVFAVRHGVVSIR